MEPLTWALAAVFSLACAGLAAYALVQARAADVAARDAATTAEMLRAKRDEAKAERERRAARPDTPSQLKLNRAGIDMPSTLWGALRIGSALAGAAAAQALLGNPVTAAAAGAAAFAGFGIYRKKKGDSMQQTLSAQLASALPQVAANLKSGMTVEAALKSTADVAEEPFKSQLDRMNAQLVYGVRIDEALMDMALRTGNADVKLVAVAVGMQQDSGGELSFVLERIAGKVQARLSLGRRVASATSSVRASRAFLCAMPWVFVLMTTVLIDGGGDFWRSFAGGAVAVAMLLMEVAGAWAMSRVMDLKLDGLGG